MASFSNCSFSSETSTELDLLHSPSPSSERGQTSTNAPSKDLINRLLGACQYQVERLQEERDKFKSQVNTLNENLDNFRCKNREQKQKIRDQEDMIERQGEDFAKILAENGEMSEENKQLKAKLRRLKLKTRGIIGGRGSKGTKRYLKVSIRRRPKTPIVPAVPVKRMKMKLANNSQPQHSERECVECVDLTQENDDDESSSLTKELATVGGTKNGGSAIFKNFIFHGTVLNLDTIKNTSEIKTSVAGSKVIIEITCPGGTFGKKRTKL